MNSIRPSILHPSPTSRRVMLVLANNARASNAKVANFAWKYWRRSYTNQVACWNQLRTHHLGTAELTNDERKESRYTLRAFHLPSPLLSPLSNLHGDSSYQYQLRMQAAPMAIPVRYMSSNIPKSKLDFSTSTLGAMPHSTSASSKENEKQKSKDDGDLSKLPASQRARALFKKYGAVFVGTYMGIYVTTLLTFFVTLDFGLLDPDTFSQLFKVSKDMACETADIIGPTGTGASMNEAANAYAQDVTTEISEDKRTLVDIISGYLKSWDWTSKYAEKLSDNPHLANLAVAWFMVKFTEPVRLAAAVIVTPKVSRALGRKAAPTGEGEKATSR